MAREVELYLMQKFRSGLDVSERIISQIPGYNQFQEIKSLLEQVFSSSLPLDSSVRDQLYNLNNVLSECKMWRRKHGFNTPEELLTVNRIKRELNKIKKELNVTIDNRAASSNGNIVPPQCTNGQTRPADRGISISTLSVDASEVYGFDDDVLSMKKLLFEQGSDDRFKAVGIVGRDGIGKTTLCQLVFNSQEVKEKFFPRICVHMSRHAAGDDEDLRIALVKRMLMHLGGRRDVMRRGLEGMMDALHCQLKGKRYLIVLDDARDSDSWYGPLDSHMTPEKKWDDEFAFAFPKGDGGRVIVTSRDEEIAKMMVGKKNVHELQLLSNPDDCWAIFKDTDTTDWIPQNPPNLEDLKLAIKQKCGGLPLAAKLMGQALQELLAQQQE